MQLGATELDRCPPDDDEDETPDRPGGARMHASRRRGPARRGIVDAEELLRRLGGELARAAMRDRELALVVLRPATGAMEAASAAAVSALLAERPGVAELAAFLDEGQVAVLMPRLDEEAALARAAELVRGTELAAGVAVAPLDGIHADTLVAAACAAAGRTGAGRVGRAVDAVERFELGRHVAVVADVATQQVYALTRRIARADMSVSIHGETGTGKELIAAAIHLFSTRAGGPFVALNCAAIPEGLAEAELFGHARGAFTGASSARAGQIEAASGGTLFLDEIAELSPAMQARLLRVIETGESRRVGENETRQVDLRIVCASLKDLRAEVDAGRFRKDLYYRVSAARIEVPPLRDRPRDLAVLTRRFAEEACARNGRPAMTLAPAAARALLGHHWPGNIRELRHVIDYAVAAAPDDARQLLHWHLPARLTTRAGARPAPAPGQAFAVGTMHEVPVAAFRSVAEEVQALERQRMVEALRAAEGVQIKAAELIDMPARTFATKFKRYGIAPTEFMG
jgi:two-component system, NtrC family, response regulator AtoC